MDTERADHLKVLGLDDDEIKVYQHLLRTGPASIAELDDAVPDRDRPIDSTLGGLVRAGLARRSGSDHSRYLPVPPDAGLEAMTLRRESELKQARIQVLNAYDEFRRTVHNESTTHLIEVVTGTAIVQRIRQIKSGAQREILAIDSPPYYIGGPNQEEIDHLKRGVSYRVVYSPESVEVPGYLTENILPCVEAGEQARVLPDVPAKLTIIDGSIAFVSMSVRDTDVNRSLLIIRPSSLLTALMGMFELCWRNALPLHASVGAEDDRLEPIERRLLALLATGAADDTIARTLGISRRTFFRYLERLMNRTGASTRFQLALHAARESWL
ncbi:helix-turn-helix domain-containing protein [Kribbella solani]|uniref:Sugar-specific transcriptional regulator TrmB/DNA-binding CsgD family transcriptional regulator n=1 Tax=Kribbella solani TaxID=236067 RepID=A0A841DTU6_9ACTN|nr:helix-turn-helix domain-containing protein [Kribbella solani]MBB5981479.1 sugar-specific transcriptional regulator TrmB/DNA-binding CsgD family transcriptional regulator [Kribbella solani]MDX2971465.1 helix-turn-helix domain-containing protein [Kribbella solani]MDX3005768.1 helix-turn-helix domain-containing protein [Kribbella solani]